MGEKGAGCVCVEGVGFGERRALQDPKCEKADSVRKKWGLNVLGALLGGSEYASSSGDQERAWHLVLKGGKRGKFPLR